METKLLAGSVVLLLAIVPATATPPTIHVIWTDPGQPPELGSDYIITTTDPDFPDVDLVSESMTWQVWSTDPDNAGGVGDIGVISSLHPKNFGVKIEDDQGGPGARNVKGINLDPTDTNKYSEITGGSITGNLDGVLFVQEDVGGTGGSADGFTISGNVDGDVTLGKGAGFTITGQFGTQGGPVRTLTVEEIVGGDLTIGNINNTAIDVTDKISAGRLVITANALTANDITIQTMENGSTLLIGDSQSAFADVEMHIVENITLLSGGIQLGPDSITPRDLDGTIRVNSLFAALTGIGMRDLTGELEIGVGTGGGLNGAVLVDGSLTGSIKSRRSG